MDSVKDCLNEALDLIYAIANNNSDLEDMGNAYYENWEDLASLIKAALLLLEREQKK